MLGSFGQKMSEMAIPPPGSAAPRAAAEDFSHATLGGLGRRVFRLGFSASYRPGKPAVHRALDAGVNVFFGYGFDWQLTGVLRELPSSQRQQLVYVTGAYNLLWCIPTCAARSKSVFANCTPTTSIAFCFLA